jgi:hypothetical protein
MGAGISWRRAVVESADAACEGAVVAGVATGAGGDAVFGGGANPLDAVGWVCEHNSILYSQKWVKRSALAV